MAVENQPNSNDPSDFEISAVRKNDVGDFTVTLPRGKFAEFLLGFLGPKETMSKPYKGDFIVKLEDILQFHYLLLQKIKNEQFISLSLATSTLQYDNGENRTANTIESLEKFNEYRDLEVVSFSLVWNFLFRAPENASIQQQKVSLLFNTRAADGAGIVTVTIEHTNQEWAVSVLRMFEEQIKKITIEYSILYRALTKLRQFNVLGLLMTLAIAALVVGVIYIAVQRNDLKGPLKVEAEFMFDLADVLSPDLPKMIDPSASALFDPDKQIDKQVGKEPVLPSTALDSGLLMQFFLIRDLRNSSPGVIEHLRQLGYFDQRYSHIIDKLKDGYYDQDVKSERIVRSLKSEMARLRTIENVENTISYLKIALLYAAIYVVSAFYIRMFRMRSIIAITSKSNRALQKQEKEKSTLAQLLFGIAASIIAAVIYDLILKLVV